MDRICLVQMASISTSTKRAVFSRCHCILRADRSAQVLKQVWLPQATKGGTAIVLELTEPVQPALT